MIGNWIKNALVAVVLNAGIAYAFDDKSPAPAEASVPAQACLVPMPARVEVLSAHDTQPDQHGSQS